MFHALGAAVPSTPQPYYLVAIAAGTLCAAGWWLRFLSR